MPAVGKSTYGRVLAKELAMQFIDTDDIVESLAGKSCADIVNQDGIEAFAKQESLALRHLLDNNDYLNSVIATGGSAIYRQEMNSFVGEAFIVHLFCRSNTLEKRIGSVEERGVVFPHKMSFAELYSERMPLYAKVADIEFSTDSKNGNESQLSKKLLNQIKAANSQYKQDEFWMQQALNLAKTAAKNHEVPVGALVVVNGEKIGEGYNQPIVSHDPTAHAEIIAIRQACANLNNYRINNATLYVTLEPCAMCAGAIIQSRIQRVVYAASDPRAGAVKSVFNVLQNTKLNHRCDVSSGLHKKSAVSLMQDFFKRRR